MFLLPRDIAFGVLLSLLIINLGADTARDGKSRGNYSADWSLITVAFTYWLLASIYYGV